MLPASRLPVDVAQLPGELVRHDADFHTRRDFNDVMRCLGGARDQPLRYVKSGSTGHVFETRGPGERKVAVKLVAYTRRPEFGSVDDATRPENAEVRMLKLLSDFVYHQITPHIVLPLCSYHTDLEPFVVRPEPQTRGGAPPPRAKKYAVFWQKYHDRKFHETANVLISEWVSGGDLLEYLRGHVLTPLQWKVVLFQVLFTLAAVQKRYPAFRHNDLKANNILVDISAPRPETFHRYTFDEHAWDIPDAGIQTRMWDFDFACIPGVVDNKKVDAEFTSAVNVTTEPNRYYDVHFFLNTLVSFFPRLEETCDDDLRRFLRKSLPPTFRDPPVAHEEHKRLLHNCIRTRKGSYQYPHEYCTPGQLIYDDYFSEFQEQLAARQAP